MGNEVVSIAVEGDHDSVAIKRILSAVGLEPGPIYAMRGKGALDQRIQGFNRSARHYRWLIIRDLDQDAECAPKLAGRLIPEPERLMCFRVAVRSLEAWLLADREEISRFLHVPLTLVPLDPEALPHPKQALINLAQRSKQRAIREDMVPMPGMGALVGRGYTARLMEFASGRWSPQRAAKHSDSLHRCLRALERWA